MISSRKCSFLRALTALLLVLALLPGAAAFAESAADLVLAEGETEGNFSGDGSWIPSDADRFTNDRASKAYIQGAFYPSMAKSSTVLADRLNAENRKFYDRALKKISDTASGSVSHVIFEVPFSFTCTIASVQNSKQKFQEKLNEQVRMVMEALLGDCPSELYWFDKVNGAVWDFTASYNNYYIWIDEIRIGFYVAKDYSLNNTTKSFYMDQAKAQSIQAAAATAKAIVAANRGKSDDEKLRAYKNEICALVDYNSAAAADSSLPYGNPWQLVWVFDGDPATSVLCEGYAKAFQYLWELSSFNGDITSMLMSGTLLTGDGKGKSHMWNVVTMSNNKKYMVDVTNCDTGSTGSEQFFLTGYDYTTTINGAKAYCYSGLYYVFSRDVTGLYWNSDQNLNGTDYDPDDDVYEHCGVCGVNADWSISADGTLKISGSGDMYDYAGASATPWYTWRNSVKKIVVDEKITKIGSNAFNGLKKAKSALIGKDVKKIGAGAFYKCSKLTDITIRTTKLKASRVGDNAFKGTPKKAVFTCPSGKVTSYRKLLIKKGANKKATFR